MTAQKIAFFYRNRTEDADFFPSSEAGDDFRSANLANYQLQEKWRSVGSTGQYVTMDYTATELFDTVILWSHNLSSTASIRVRIADNLAMTDPVYDSDHDAWPALYGYDEGGYDEAGYDGLPVLSELNGYARYTIILLPSVYAGRYMRLDFTDSENTDGYIECGWLGTGKKFQPTHDFSYGTNVAGWIDPSDRTKMQAGNTFVTKRNKYRAADYSLEFLTRAEAFGDFADMLRVCGCSRPVVVMPYPDDETLLYRASIYGLIVNASDIVPIEQIRQDYTATSYRTTLTIEELL